MIVRGPFNIEWGDNILTEVSGIEIDLERNTEEYVDNSGNIFELEKGTKISALLTLLASDTESLAALLPQIFVESGGALSNGDLVTSSVGAIDFSSLNCDDELVFNDLRIISCKDEREILILPRCRTRIEDIEIDKIRKVKVRFLSEEQGVLRMSREDHLILDNGEDFLLDDGQRLIL